MRYRTIAVRSFGFFIALLALVVLSGCSKLPLIGLGDNEKNEPPQSVYERVEYADEITQVFGPDGKTVISEKRTPVRGDVQSISDTAFQNKNANLMDETRWQDTSGMLERMWTSDSAALGAAMTSRTFSPAELLFFQQRADGLLELGVPQVKESANTNLTHSSDATAFWKSIDAQAQAIAERDKANVARILDSADGLTPQGAIRNGVASGASALLKAFQESGIVDSQEPAEATTPTPAANEGGTQ